MTVSDIHHRLTDDRNNQLSCRHVENPLFTATPSHPRGRIMRKKETETYFANRVSTPAPIPPDVTEYVLIRGPCCKVGTGNKPT